MKTAVVCGSSGFIGRHLAQRLHKEGYNVVGLSRSVVTNQNYMYSVSIDLRYLKPNDPFFESVDSVYQLACEVGGIGYISNHANDADMLRNSTQIDLAVLESCRFNKVPKVFFASSACVYNIAQKRFYAESDAYPANCANEFAWQKLFAERLYESYARNYGIDVKIGRLFNTYGAGMVWSGGREKSVAALCRKIAEIKPNSPIDVWGTGEQTRSYTYIDDCVEGIWRLMQSKVCVPLNIGPSHEVTIRDLVKAISEVAGKNVMMKFGAGPKGVSKICSDNVLTRRLLGWEPQIAVEQGLKTVYPWVEKQVLDKNKNA